MKTIKILSLITLLLCAGAAKAQLTLNVNLGLNPPAWGPMGYTEVRYYYLPAIEAYYDVQYSMFIYSAGGQWVRRNSLPVRYRNYDLYNGYKVLMSDYRGETPYVHFNDHRIKYNRAYRGIPQRSIGERPSNGQSKFVQHGQNSKGKGKGKSKRD